MKIPTFEDKIVQRAVAMLLEAIYEQDFYDGSYGFRPGRSPHNALQELRERCMTEGIGWIVAADVSGYFDSIDRTRLRDVLRQRLNDGRIVRLIGKWLRAGVWEEGVLNHPDTGVVQGETISPVLANIFLHQVLDAWFEQPFPAKAYTIENKRFISSGFRKHKVNRINNIRILCRWQQTSFLTNMLKTLELYLRKTNL